MKTHRIEEPLAGAEPAYLANGLIGLRIGRIPLPGGTALVNGFVGRSPEKGVEEYADAPYPVGADLRLNGLWLSQRSDLARFDYQELDFSCGELRSAFAFAAQGATAQVEIVTFCSRTQPTIVLQEVVVTVDQPAKLTLQARIGRTGLSGRLAYRCLPRSGHDAIVAWEGVGGLSRVGVATVSEYLGEDLDRRWRNDFGHEEDSELVFYEISAKPDRRYVLRQYGSLVPSLMHDEPHWQASRLVSASRWHGFEAMRADNRAAWAELWKGCPHLLGAEAKWQDATDAAFFYLHSSAHASMPCSIAPFGLSRRMEYSGHVFWDADTFMFPPLLLTAPDAARSMMEYRGRCLPAARFNAQLNGYRGAQFPGESGTRGVELVPFYAGGCGGIREQHITLDVAFAMAQYVHATGDDLFLRQQAWPVIEAAATWIVSRVTRTPRGFEILHVTGIDESFDNVDNNSALNIQATIVLREAIGFARRMGSKPPAAWATVAQGMFIPIDTRTHVILKHEGYVYKGGMCAPETLAAYFPFGYSHSPAVDQATIGYYMDLAHTYLGMPMLGSLLGVFAARSGERALATQVFAEGFLSHLQSPYLQFNETSKVFDGATSFTGDSVFLTNPAGFLMALLYGLTGLQVNDGMPEGWAKHPVVMPEGWDGIEVERIWVRGQAMRLSAHHGAERASLVPVDGFHK